MESESNFYIISVILIIAVCVTGLAIIPIVIILDLFEIYFLTLQGLFMSIAGSILIVLMKDVKRNHNPWILEKYPKNTSLEMIALM